MYCDGEEDRKDLFQEMMIQLWRSYPSFRGDAKFSTWMYQVGFNVAIQHLRMRKRRPQHETFQAQHVQSVEPVIGPGDQEIKQTKLDNAIRQLNPVDTAIILLYLEEKSQVEIGEIMGITSNHVGVKVSRIKSKLKKLLNIRDYA
jgi:RNA polymerase sigma-70 factor (ECF subfamily)